MNSLGRSGRGTGCQSTGTIQPSWPQFAPAWPNSAGLGQEAAGRVTTDRTELDSAIGTFWQYVGQNMRDPQWVWHDVHVDVLSRDAISRGGIGGVTKPWDRGA